MTDAACFRLLGKPEPLLRLNTRPSSRQHRAKGDPQISVNGSTRYLAIGEANGMIRRNSRSKQLCLAAVLAIISATVGGLICLSQRADETRLRDACAVRLRGLWYALTGYRLSHANAFPPGSVPADGLLPEQRLSWITLIYYYFDESQNIHFLFNSAEPWESSTNRIPMVTPPTSAGIVSSAGTIAAARWCCSLMGQSD